MKWCTNVIEILERHGEIERVLLFNTRFNYISYSFLMSYSSHFFCSFLLVHIPPFSHPIKKKSQIYLSPNMQLYQRVEKMLFSVVVGYNGEGMGGVPDWTQYCSLTKLKATLLFHYPFNKVFSLTKSQKSLSGIFIKPNV